MTFFLLTVIPTGSIYVLLSEDYQIQGPHCCQDHKHVASLQDPQLQLV